MWVITVLDYFMRTLLYVGLFISLAHLILYFLQYKLLYVPEGKHALSLLLLSPTTSPHSPEPGLQVS